MSNTYNKATRAIVEQANTWIVDMQEQGLNAQSSKRFHEWLRQSPVHVREFVRAEATWAALSGLDPNKNIDVVADLLSQDSNVVELKAPPKKVESTVSLGPRRAARVRLAAIAATVLMAIGVLGYLQVPSEHSYETAVGEQRRVILEDGSIIELNTNSTINVAMTETSRQIRLVDGEALFSVAKDPDRPFIVTINGAIVRAIGTQFNVYRSSDRVLVTVLEGRVSVRGADNSTTALDAFTNIELGQGDRAEIAPNQPIIKSEADESDTLAWRDLRLIFRDQPLSYVVDEFNRYNNTKLVIEDTNLASQKISAVFDANKPDALVNFIAAVAVVDVDYSDDSYVIIRVAR